MAKTASSTKLISWVDYSLFHASDLNWIKGSIALALSIHGLALRLMVEFTPLNGLLYILVHCGLAVGAFLSIMLLAPALFQDTIVNLRKKLITVESGFLVGILLLFFTSLTASVQRLPRTHYEVIPIALTVFAIARYWIARKARIVDRALPTFFDRVERCNRVEPSGAISRVPLVDIKVGDEIKVSTSQMVPVDGVIITGEGYVSEASLNGATFPIVKQAGDPILAGSISQDGVFTIKTLAPYVPRKMEAVVNLLLLEDGKEARCRASQLRHMACVAILGCLGLVFGYFNSGLLVGLIVLSTILMLGATLTWVSGIPIHYWTGLVHLGKRGLFGKNPDLVEGLAEINRAYFGKTGVLSREELTLERFFVMPAFQDREDWIRSLVYQTSRMVHHPLVNSLSGVEALIKNEPIVEDLRFKILPGHGIEVSFTDGLGHRLKLRIGEADYVVGVGGQVRVSSILEEHDLMTGQRIWVSLEGRLCAIAVLKEAWEVSPQPYFAELGYLNVRSGILTGESRFNDSRLDGLFCQKGLSSRDKQHLVADSIKQGEKVLFTGDGLNDYRAMSCSQISIAMRHAPDAVLAVASAILRTGGLSVIVFSIPYCRRIMKISARNRWIFSTALIVSSLAAMVGWLNPMSAVVCFLGSFGLVWLQSFLLGSSTLSRVVEETRRRRVSLRKTPQYYAQNH